MKTKNSCSSKSKCKRHTPKSKSNNKSFSKLLKDISNNIKDISSNIKITKITNTINGSNINTSKIIIIFDD